MHRHDCSRVMKRLKTCCARVAVVALFTAAPGTSHLPAASEDANTSPPRSPSSLSPKCSVVPDLAGLSCRLHGLPSGFPVDCPSRPSPLVIDLTVVRLPSLAGVRQGELV